MTQSIKSLDCLGGGVLVSQSADRLEAEGRIAGDLELFQDHFPAFPVLPGVLTVDILKRIAESAMEAGKWRLESISRVKFSSFLRPGGAWKSELILKNSDTDGMTWQGKLYDSDKAAASVQLRYKRK